ncbi:MAG: 23S rRNA (uracil(1939)-C(5))-methyltransferase RlmD [Clostridia bacterium]|nr:23S rRNA (uracil(1939)-C(5))-methyltransferase RlmD [Clostridia bacterium]
MPEKNEQLTGIVEALGSQGEGIVKVDGVTFFVPYTLVGEKINFKALKVKGNIGYGKCENVVSPSKERAVPLCSAFEKCGGCQVQHMNYEAQLSFKREQVKNTLQKVGNIEYNVPMPVPSEKQYGYRNKLQLPIGVDNNGNTVIGFYAERSHRIVPVDNCAIHPAWAEKLIAALKNYIAESGETGYDELRKTGNLRHIVARDMGEKFIVAIVTKTKKLKNSNTLIEGLKGVFPEFTLIHNINDKDTNVIFGERFITLFGSGFFDAEEGGITFEAGAQTFVQINEGIRKKMYDQALQEVAATGNEVVVDCYSGAGLLTAMAAKRAKRVYGIEIVPEASACADRLKVKNGLDNMINICGKVEDELPHVLAKEKNEQVTLILDPPRAGIHRSVLRAIEKSGIERVVLISCNPATLARDLGLLAGVLTETEDGQLVKGTDNGVYKIASLQPFDMFPQTKHVETLVCLTR